MSPRRFEVWLIALDPTIGVEIRKTRPCVVISPDEMNRHLGTVIIAPLTSTIRSYPMRVRIRFQSRDGEVALDQLRAVDRSRLLRRLGALSSDATHRVVETLVEMFS